MHARSAIALLLLIAFLAAGTLLVPRSTPATPDRLSPTAEAGATAARLRSGGPTVVSPTIGSTRPPGPAAVRPLAADSSAALAEQITLRQLAHGRDLALGEEAWAELAAVVARHQAIRHAHEASLATVMSQPHGGFVIEVPAYGDVGELLRAQLYAEVAQRLGGAAADQVLLHLGDALEGYFAGFGVSAQTLEVPTVEAFGEHFVTRTIAYSSDDDDRIRTRREMHLPGAEDPTGQRWSPFLALLQRSNARG